MTEEAVRIHEFVAHATKVNCVSVGPKSNQVIATGGEDWKVNIWRVGTVNNIWSLGHNKAPIECLCFDSEENCVVSGSFNGSVKVFDLNEGKLARNLGTHQTHVTSVQYHPYGEFLVSGSADNTMKFWDVRNKTCVETYSGHKKEITCVRFSPDGKWVASAGKDGQLLFYDLIASKHINTIKISPAYVTSFEFNPTDFSLAASTSNRAVRLWDLETMKSTYSTPPETQAVKGISFSNLGNELFIAAKSSLKIWDIENTFRQMETLEMGWDNMDIGDMKILNNDQMVAVGFNTNSSFVSVYEIDLSEYIGHGLDHNNNLEDIRDDGISQTNSQETTDTQSYEYNNNNNNDLNNNARNRRDPSPSLPGKANISTKVQPQLPSQEKIQAKDSDEYSHNIIRRMNDEYLNNDLAPFKPAGKPPAISRKEVPSELKAIPEDSESKGYFDDDKVIPSVELGEGYSNDMAASMGDSFWRKFKEIQNNPVSTQIKDRKLQQEDEDAIKISNALERLLPPSGFDDYESDYVKPQPKIVSRSNIQVDDNKPPFTSPTNNNPPLKVVARRESKPSSNERPLSSNAAMYNNVNYANIQDLESKGIEGLAIVGSNKHIAPTTHHAAAAGRANYPIEGVNSNQPPPQSEPVDGIMKSYDQIDKLLNNSTVTSNQLSQRLTQLKILRNLWRRGDVFLAIDHLQVLLQEMKNNGQATNLYILSDFFNAMNLQHQHLTLDACVKLLPILEEMLLTCNVQKTHSEQAVVINAVYKSLVSLALAFGELIRSTRSAISVGQQRGGGGVDLSREARLEKCNQCYEVFQKAKQRMEIVKYQYRNQVEVVELLEQYHKLCQQYF